MKQFLSHFQNYLMLGIAIIGNFSYGLPAINSTRNLAESIQTFSTLSEFDPDEAENDFDDNSPVRILARNSNDDITGEEDFGEPAENLFDFGSGLIIKAINPGYSLEIDGVKYSDTGEFIELQNLTGEPIALGGYALKYSYGSSEITLFSFPEGSYMTGERLLFKYTKTYNAQEADLTYSKSISMDAGPLKLIYMDEDGEEYLADSVCWRKDATLCEGYNTTAKFVSTIGKRKVAVRNLESGDFEQLLYDEYVPEFIAEASGLVIPEEVDEDNPEDTEKPAPHCQGLEFSELLTYYANDKSEQFIELFNPTAQEIDLAGCKVVYKNKTYELTTGTVKSGGYYAYQQSAQFSLTKNPTNPLSLTLLDADDTVLDEMAYGNGQKKLTSYAKVFASDGTEDWQITYAITPGAENIYQKFRSCEEGKIINEATGNCVKATTATSVATLAPCPAGQYRNPLTNRCKKIETASTSLKDCAEGYERNPETNRCRKISQSNDGAEYALVPNTRTDETVFIGIGIVIMIIALGLIYVILQFRHEIARAARKAGQRINHIRQDLLARGIGRHPHK